MKLIVEGIDDGKARSRRSSHSACQDAEGHIRLGENLNPAIRWHDLARRHPKSLVLICVDTDAPTRPDDVNQEGKHRAVFAAARRFYHWVLVDLAPDLEGIAEGECSRGVTPRGKSVAPRTRGFAPGAQ
jgi:phosphatidylethanolamine-binding protein (PEBP) family uncharacterized protein